MQTRYTVFIGKDLYSLPKVGWNAVVVRRYALPYQAISSREWNCVVMLGIAVPMITVSSATRKVPKHSDIVITTSFHDGFEFGSRFGNTGFSFG